MKENKSFKNLGWDSKHIANQAIFKNEDDVGLKGIDNKSEQRFDSTQAAIPTTTQTQESQEEEEISIENLTSAKKKIGDPETHETQESSAYNGNNESGYDDSERKEETNLKGDRAVSTGSDASGNGAAELPIKNIQSIEKNKLTKRKSLFYQMSLNSTSNLKSEENQNISNIFMFGLSDLDGI